MRQMRRGFCEVRGDDGGAGADSRLTRARKDARESDDVEADFPAARYGWIFLDEALSAQAGVKVSKNSQLSTTLQSQTSVVIPGSPPAPRSRDDEESAFFSGDKRQQQLQIPGYARNNN